MTGFDAIRTMLALALVVGTLSAIGPHVSYGQFNDGHTSTGSLTAASKYNGGGSGGPCSQIGKHEVAADAGEDITVAEDGQVTLDGSNSCSNGGSIQSYSWEIDTNPPVGSLADGIGQQEPYYAPSNVESDTVVYITLVVENNKQSTDSDTIRITVEDQNGG